MKCLDLFCCDGGAAMGLSQAGFDEIVGIDIESHPNYPFEFIQGDATDPPVDPKKFDFIWSSPPCQDSSLASNDAKIHHGKIYPQLIPKTRELLLKSGKPFVIENVVNAPIRNDLTLCGLSFGLNLFRHRRFEIHGFKVVRKPHCLHSYRHKIGINVVGVYGNGSVRDGNSHKVSVCQEAMGIFHTDVHKALREAVPPAYSEYIGREFFRTRGASCSPL